MFIVSELSVRLRFCKTGVKLSKFVAALSSLEPLAVNELLSVSR
ncbi:MAG: hypothetical protein OFPI_13320 [Osedax symbiont Rs2]|nr:MAG: hypothetical protein OFPI_13320 [Osedax symbiont Rs2]